MTTGQAIALGFTIATVFWGVFIVAVTKGRDEDA